MTFGYWIPVWISDYWPLVVGGKAIATLGAVHDSWIRGDGAHRRPRDGVRDVRASRIPRLTTTVGYDARFSGGHFGVWVVTDPDRADDAMDILKKHGAEEVRRER